MSSSPCTSGIEPPEPWVTHGLPKTSLMASIASVVAAPPSGAFQAPKTLWSEISSCTQRVTTARIWTNSWFAGTLR